MAPLPRLFLLTTLAALPLGAQKAKKQNPQSASPPDPSPPMAVPAANASAKKDTVTARKAADGSYVLDFQDQDIRVVLSALAEAGGLNVSLSNLPSRRVTLRMGQTASKEALLNVMRGVAAANDLKITESPSLIRIEGPAPAATQTPLQTLQQQQQQAQLKLYTYRLKHASAVQLAPVLTTLLTGVGTSSTAGRGGAANTGLGAIFQPGGAAGAGGAAGGLGVLGGVAAAQGGRGGGGGGGGAAGGGRGGGAGGGLGGGGLGGGAAQQVLQAFQNQLLGGGAALSNSAADIRIVAEEVTNSLLIRATSDDWALLQSLLATVDLRPLQVLIEVTIAQVQRTKDLNIGLSGIQTNKQSATVTDTMALLPGAASARDFVLQLTGGKGAINYNVAMNALSTRGDVKVLSLPVIIAQNNKEAILNVGSQRPFVQVSQSVASDPTGRVQTVQYINVGTTLTITPTINPDGYVNLAVKQTDNAATNEIQFSAPVISTREATTQVFLRDGQTTVIGGLADNTTSNSTSGLPYLSRLPLIGWIFGNQQKSTVASELFLFLTPHVVSSDEDIDRLRQSVQTGSELLLDVPINGRISPSAKADSMPGAPNGPKPPTAPKATPVLKPDSLAPGKRPGTPGTR